MLKGGQISGQPELEPDIRYIPISSQNTLSQKTSHLYNLL